MNIEWESFTVGVLAQVPVLLVILGGLIWCAVRFPDEPRRALLVSIALAMDLGLMFLGPIVTTWIFNMARTDDSASLHARILANGLVHSLPAALSLLLLLIAALAPRPRVRMPDQDGE